MNKWIRDSSVCIVTGYGLDGRVSIPGKDKKWFSCPKLPNWFWSPLILLFNGYTMPPPHPPREEVGT
jgi:hypothetical protein